MAAYLCQNFVVETIKPRARLAKRNILPKGAEAARAGGDSVTWHSRPRLCRTWNTAEGSCATCRLEKDQGPNGQQISKPLKAHVGYGSSFALAIHRARTAGRLAIGPWPFPRRRPDVFRLSSPAPCSRRGRVRAKCTPCDRLAQPAEPGWRASPATTATHAGRPGRIACPRT